MIFWGTPSLVTWCFPSLLGDCVTIKGMTLRQNLNWHSAPPVVVVIQSLSRVQLFATPRTAARQASLSSTVSRSLLRLISIESVMPSGHFVIV